MIDHAQHGDDLVQGIGRRIALRQRRRIALVILRWLFRFGQSGKACQEIWRRRRAKGRHAQAKLRREKDAPVMLEQEQVQHVHRAP
ncbi:hypothetical protein, partial [Massilia mucilaginosa]|uniref:hypothetical protein n=1 Tax=Massilia mucilaginosa TaxID=2609282 RepID=UPI001CB6E57A